MAYIQVEFDEARHQVEEQAEDLIAVSSEAGGILVFKGEKAIVRVKLNKQEAGAIAAKLAPHIP